MVEIVAVAAGAGAAAGAKAGAVGWRERVWCGANIMQSLKIRSYKLNLEAEG